MALFFIELVFVLQRLGVHSEMFSDGVLDLVKQGVIDGSMKTTEAGKLVSTFLIGTKVRVLLYLLIPYLLHLRAPIDITTAVPTGPTVPARPSVRTRPTVPTTRF